MTRGFQSCMEPFLHFGLGKEAIIDRLEIVWSDGSKQSLQNVSANQLLTVKYDDAKPDPISDNKPQPGLFRPIGPSNGSIFTHKETISMTTKRKFSCLIKCRNGAPH